MAIDYRPAPEVAKIGRRLIHAHHRRLRNVRVEFVFRSHHARHFGRPQLAATRKVAGLFAFLSSETGRDGTAGALVDFFVVQVAEDLWRDLNDAQREALIDHELSHCGVYLDDDENPVLSIRPHDLGEFRGVVERHGVWTDELRQLAQALTKA